MSYLLLNLVFEMCIRLSMIFLLGPRRERIRFFRSSVPRRTTQTCEENDGTYTPLWGFSAFGFDIGSDGRSISCMTSPFILLFIIMQQIRNSKSLRTRTL